MRIYVSPEPYETPFEVDLSGVVLYCDENELDQLADLFDRMGADGLATEMRETFQSVAYENRKMLAVDEVEPVLVDTTNRRYRWDPVSELYVLIEAT
jgi:hypothetical protein